MSPVSWWGASAAATVLSRTFCSRRPLKRRALLDMFLARVSAGAPPGAVSRLSHLVLRVALNDQLLLADVGFGRNALLEPIPFEPDGVHTQNGWSFRIVDEDTERVLQ